MIEAPAAPSCVRAVPWQADRNHLWSLLDMLELNARHFLGMVQMIDRAKAMFHPSGDDDTRILGRRTLGLAMVMLKDQGANLPLSNTFREKIDRLKKKADDQSGIWDVDDLMLLVHEVEADFKNELDSHVFLSVRSDARLLYEKPSEWYGEPTVSVFHKADGHMRDSARCFALEQWTATVFHAMCVLEYGLADLYKRVGAKPKSPDWHQVIRAIQLQITALRNTPKALTPARKRRLDAYDEAAVQFSHFKNAWRNHVNHGRERYNEKEATEICDAVRRFMAHIASWRRRKQA